MDISKNDIDGVNSFDQVLKRLQDIRSRNPRTEVFVTLTDTAAALDDGGRNGQLVIADGANPVSLLLSAQLALNAAQAMLVEHVKHHPDSLIESGTLAAAAQAAAVLIARTIGSDLRPEAVVGDQRDDSDEIGPTIGRA